MVTIIDQRISKADGCLGSSKITKTAVDPDVDRKARRKVVLARQQLEPAITAAAPLRRCIATQLHQLPSPLPWLTLRWYPTASTCSTAATTGQLMRHCRAQRRAAPGQTQTIRSPPC